MSVNPHVMRVHLPAHFLGLLGIAICLFSPSWWALAGFLFCNIWFSCFGMSIGFHRYFTHKSFKTSKFWHYVMLSGGCLAAQGSPVFWVALHRMHHPSSDQPEDIHSPIHKGFWHGYMGWIFSLDPIQVPMSRASDLIRDPVMRFAHRHYDKILWTYWLILFVVAMLGAYSLVGGMLVAGVWSIHQEALINSVCHDPRFGSAPNEAKTNDSSRNVFWLQFLTWGQSLHNNHHAYPASPNFGSTKDIGYRIIELISSEQKLTK